MSTITLNGLRFRRVAIVSEPLRQVFRDVKRTQPCDAMICRRCTSVVTTNEMAERHVCMPANWMCGADIEDLGAIAQPDRPRERVRTANAAHVLELWPHGMRVPRPRSAAPLVERYETLSVLFGELVDVELGIERTAPLRAIREQKRRRT